MLQEIKVQIALLGDLSKWILLLIPKFREALWGMLPGYIADWGMCVASPLRFSANHETSYFNLKAAFTFIVFA